MSLTELLADAIVNSCSQKLVPTVPARCNCITDLVATGMMKRETRDRDRRQFDLPGRFVRSTEAGQPTVINPGVAD